MCWEIFSHYLTGSSCSMGSIALVHLSWYGCVQTPQSRTFGGCGEFNDQILHGCVRFSVRHFVCAGCTYEFGLCINVTSIVLAYNVLRITAACSINPHYMIGANALSDCVAWVCMKIKTSPNSAAFLTVIRPVFRLSQAATCMDPVGSLRLNTCHRVPSTT